MGIPFGAARLEPPLGGGKRAGVNTTGSGAPDFLRAYQAAGFQYLHVLHDCRERHRNRLREFADGRRRAPETLDHGAPRRIGQGVEDAVQIDVMVKHIL